jgi:hypothetical protein
MPDMSRILAAGKSTENTPMIKNRRVSPSCHNVLNPDRMENVFLKIMNLLNVITGAAMPIPNVIHEAHSKKSSSRVFQNSLIGLESEAGSAGFLTTF